MAEQNNGAWAQLVSTTDVISDPVLLVSDKFTIGRSKGCNLSLSENRLVSSTHCVIERCEDGTVWITDTSTNGTLINKQTQLRQHERKELQHGDEIMIVFAKTKSEYNVAYLFQDLKTLASEDVSGSEPSSSLNQTLPMDEWEEGDDGDGESPSKRVCVRNEAVESPSTSKSMAPLQEVVAPSTSKSSSTRSTAHTGTTLSVSSSTPKSTPSTAATSSISTSSAAASSSTSIPSTAAPAKIVDNDRMAESLLCSICQEIMHDCVSLQPCMHSFCAGCYSGWMERSRECPTCRNRVDRISKNHIVNNLVEAYVTLHPDKKRPDEEVKLLDDQNKITRDMLYPKKQGRRHDLAGDDSGDSYTDDNDDDDDDYGGGAGSGGFGLVNPFIIYSPYHATSCSPAWVKNTRMARCRQCPGYVSPTPGSTTCSTPGSTPSSTQYQCGTSSQHIMCMCCYQLMPNRSQDRTQDNTIPPQQCCVCNRSYCHMYWTCNKVGCRGCLNAFQDIDFDDFALTGILLENDYESNVLKDYLRANSISVRDMLRSCLTKLDQGHYTCPDQASSHLSSTSIICHSCSLRNLKELAYQYRRDLPASALPGHVTSRSDCWWGRNCRTQTCKPIHARNLNHICDQTRFK